MKRWMVGLAIVVGVLVVQTLEPRAYYLYIPYKDQSSIPLFDTAVADFNYAQIFSENSFVGGDRVNDANQVTLALTSRLLTPSSGQEVLRGTVAQRFYFRDQRVTLNAATLPRDFSESDWLASLAVFGWVFLVTFPVAIPFMFMTDADRALRVSNAVAVAMLSVVGYGFGRCIRRNPLATAALTVVCGAAIVAATIALGG